MADEEDNRYRGVLETLGELAQEIRDHKAAVEQSWQTHRATVNSAIGILSSEVVRLQNLFDQFVKERKADRGVDEEGRQAERKKAGRFRIGFIAAMVALTFVNCLAIALAAAAIAYLAMKGG